jgi:hypothetical protein
MRDEEVAAAAFAAEVFQEAVSAVEDSLAADFAAASQAAASAQAVWRCHVLASASRVISGPAEHAGLEVSVRDGVAAGVATDPVGATGRAGVGRQLDSALQLSPLAPTMEVITRTMATVTAVTAVTPDTTAATVMAIAQPGHGEYSTGTAIASCGRTRADIRRSNPSDARIEYK